jgi:G3E family GTPase
MQQKTIPVIILGGYLGAGKTTLLNRLLSEQHGLRLAVIVNDFGAINVDAGLIQSSDGETIALTNGCICCGMANNFMEVMFDLRNRAGELDGVVVETSGVADPAQAGAYATMPGFRLAAILVLADAERVQRLSRDSLIGRSVSRQLQAADVIIVTKGDLAGNEKTRTVVAWVKERVPAANVIATPAGSAPVNLLFDALSSASSRLEAGQHDDGDHHEHAHHDEHGDLYVRATAWPQQPVTRAALQQWYAALPDSILRVKGWLRLEGEGDQPFVMQGVGKRLSVTPAGAHLAQQPSMLILLGLPGSLDGVSSPDGTPLKES